LRLGRALALEPRALLAEHPSAPLADEDSSHFAVDLSRITERRGIATLVITADPAWRSVGDRVLELQPATGALIEKKSRWRRWFS
jgi:ABC-type lipoprotein export system ATPase subunit